MFTFWHRWLQIACAGLVLLGLDMAFFGTTILFAPLNDPLNMHFFATTQVSPAVASYQAFTYGIIGALTAGWGLLACLVARHAIARREAWAWYGLTMGLVLWYGVDSVLSAYHGAMANVISNTLFAIPVVIPLVALRGHIFTTAPRVQGQAV